MLKYLILVALIYSTCVLEAAKTHSSTKKASTTVEVPKAKVHSYTVIKVADGDTITVKNNTDKSLVRIRFLCIDAPEKSQPKWGSESLKQLNDLLPLNTEVKLNGEKKDLYGRTVAEVINNKGVNVNKKMVEIGYVVHYKFQKGCNDYALLEKGAQSSKLGVWGDSKFEMPWDYRQRMGIGARGKDFVHQTTLPVQQGNTKQHLTRARAASKSKTISTVEVAKASLRTKAPVRSSSTSAEASSFKSSSTTSRSKTSSTLKK